MSVHQLLAKMELPALTRWIPSGVTVQMGMKERTVKQVTTFLCKKKNGNWLISQNMLELGIAFNED